MPAVKFKTDRQCLLAGVRRRKLDALLQLYDCWIDEGAERQVEAFERLQRCVRWSHENRARLRIGIRENVYRAFRDFAYQVNKLERTWRLPAIKSLWGSTADEWMRYGQRLERYFRLEERRDRLTGRHDQVCRRNAIDFDMISHARTARSGPLP